MKSKVIFVLIVVFLIGLAQPTFAKNPIGMILEGYDKDCKVQRQAKNGFEIIKCEYGMELFEDDVIVKNHPAKKIKIQWLSPPYTGAEELSTTRLKVVFNSPADKNGFRSKINSFLTFVGLGETPHYKSITGTKGTRDEISEFEDNIFVPRPGYNSTVLPEYPITFAWGKKGGKEIVFHDGIGNTIFQKAIKGEANIELTPKEIGLNPNKTYTWSVDGVRLYGLYKVSFLKDEIEQLVMGDIKKIDQEDISDDERKIQKSAYLQLMSDTYPEEIDLYWLSYKVLNGINNNELADKLKERYFNHLNNTFISK